MSDEKDYYINKHGAVCSKRFFFFPPFKSKDEERRYWQKVRIIKRLYKNKKP